MELQLIYFIIFPLIGIGLELLISKIFKKITGFTTIIFSAIMLVLALLFFSQFDATQKGVQFIYEYPWVSEWGLSFKLALDGIGCLGTALFSIIFFVVLIISKKKERNTTHYVMMALLQITVFLFLLSYDFVLKILFWEASWIPIFFLLVNSSKKSFAILYSKYWFLSEVLIVIACLLLFKTTGMSYDVEKITQVHAGETATFIIMSLMIIGTMIRTALFPFSLFMEKAIHTCEENISAVVAIIMTIIPLFFMVSIVIPLFLKELIIYTDLISIIVLLSMLVCIIKLFIDKRISTIIYAQILMFNATTFIWLIRPTNDLLGASFEIIITKSLINIVILYLGKAIISDERNNSQFNKWLFIISIIISFGIPGIINIGPVFKLISSWYSINSYVSISI
ncbi:MAG: proton-conducting transporter membrane subunit, partial [bacterium]